jgi:protocatechuate 3,4-dioxygenase beta subunit
MNYVFYTTVAVALLLWLNQPSAAAETPCPPTASDAEGPYYKPDAPIRESTGRGLRVSGKVKSAGSCTVIPKARVEWWQTNPKGRYDDEHRGVQLTSSDGSYHFETDFPPGYFFRPPHIHFKIFALGHRTLTTQVYPKKGQSSIAFDFVLIKE